MPTPRAGAEPARAPLMRPGGHLNRRRIMARWFNSKLNKPEAAAVSLSCHGWQVMLLRTRARAPGGPGGPAGAFLSAAAAGSAYSVTVAALIPARRAP